MDTYLNYKSRADDQLHESQFSSLFFQSCTRHDNRLRSLYVPCHFQSTVQGKRIKILGHPLNFTKACCAAGLFKRSSDLSASGVKRACHYFNPKRAATSSANVSARLIQRQPARLPTISSFSSALVGGVAQHLA